MSAIQAQADLTVKSPHSFYISGEWVEPSSSETLTLISPVTEVVLMTFAEAQAAIHGTDEAVALDIKRPFGGFKQSGMGRAKEASRGSRATSRPRRSTSPDGGEHRWARS